jgi:hypothetical protein
MSQENVEVVRRALDAFNRGKTARLTYSGAGREHTVVPYFFSDLADWVSMEWST